jgi:hypothetical protein
LTASSSGQNYYYDPIKIDISQDGIYQFQNISSLDMDGYLYENSFNSTNVYSNLMNYDDGSGGNFQFSVQISLTSSNSYILVATTFYPFTTGSFSIEVTGPATVNFN